MTPRFVPPIVYILMGVLGLWGAYLYGRLNPSPTAPASAEETQFPSGASLITSLPDPVVVQMDGSVTMVQMIKRLQNAYAQIYPSTPTTYGIPEGKPNGSNQGLKALLNGSVVIAASSRPLNATEAQAGIQVIPIAFDAIAVVVGVNNPYQGGLTLDQLSGIYQGQITNWSQVGGANIPIKVLNRSLDSGTREMFQDIVLLDQPFAADGPNFITFDRDVTTPILRALGTNGIGYTTVSQAVNQQTVRILAIDTVLPTDTQAVRDGLYPIRRSMFLAVPRHTSTAVKNFVDLALSPQGQRIVQQSGYIPVE